MKFRNNWLNQMANRKSSQYRLMDGNIVDAVSSLLLLNERYLHPRSVPRETSFSCIIKVQWRLKKGGMIERKDGRRDGRDAG